MYSSTFIFLKKKFYEEFYELDNAIAEVAKSIPGYLGEETWENSKNGYVANVYYWDSLDALRELMQNPKHLHAKALQEKWLNGYQVVISQVLRTYGNKEFGALPEQKSND
jgi:heme-degrading monooxygenase HmoA